MSAGNCVDSLSWRQLVLRKELEDRMARKDWKLEWADVIRDVDDLTEMEIAIGGKGYVFRGEAKGTTGKVFQACGVALPPILRKCETPTNPLPPEQEGNPCH